MGTMLCVDKYFDSIYGYNKPYTCFLSNGVSKSFPTHHLAWAYGENWKMLTGNGYIIRSRTLV